MKILSWNVNGIRSVARYGFLEWMQAQRADIVCLQETKARAEQLEAGLLAPKGYTSFWHSAEKAGYSGVAIYSRQDPLRIQHGIGVPGIDREGRVLVAEFPGFTLLNAYFPNSQRDHARLGYKLEFCGEILRFCDNLRRQGVNVVLCGDYNIAHQEIDLKNPKSNQMNAGFLPQEREWMSGFLKAGYVDSFRHFTPDPGHYTWWSYRPGVREKNIGWRIDYFCVNGEFQGRLKKAYHLPDVKGSDHCPIAVELK